MFNNTRPPFDSNSRSRSQSASRLKKQACDVSTRQQKAQQPHCVPLANATLTLWIASGKSVGRLTASLGISLPSLNLTVGTLEIGPGGGTGDAVDSTLMTAVPTFPSPPPKKRRMWSTVWLPASVTSDVEDSSVAEHAKITFLRSPEYSQEGSPGKQPGLLKQGISKLMRISTHRCTAFRSHRLESECAVDCAEECDWDRRHQAPAIQPTR